MARYDVHSHPDVTQRRTTPFLLDVQNSYLHGLDTRIVVPLRKASLVRTRLRDLHPQFEVAGEAVVMDTPALAAFPARELGHPVASLRSNQAEIGTALDAVFGAF